MENKTLSWHDVFYKLRRLCISIRYVRDAMMCTFMDIPMEEFRELEGNFPYEREDRLMLLGQYADWVDLPFYYDALSYIFESHDKDLAQQFCAMDINIWQVIILCSRYDNEDAAVSRLGKKAGELLQMVCHIKRDMLKQNLLDFDPFQIAEYATFIENAIERKKNVDDNDRFAGWKQLESAAGYEKDENERQTEIDDMKELEKLGEYAMKSALDAITIQNLYIYLGEYRNISGPGCDVGVVDMTKISLRTFEFAVRFGCYTGFEGNGHQDNLYCFICKFSRFYIKDTDGYRRRAAMSMGISEGKIIHYNKNDRFADGLQKVLPLIKYNEFKHGR